MFTYSDYVESAAVLRAKLSGFKPDVLIILGSGLGSLGENVQNPIFIDYGEIPRMRTSTAIGHKGRFIAGLLGRQACAFNAGSTSYLRRMVGRGSCLPRQARKAYRH